MIITRYHNATTLQLTVEFLTPTFLGGADQHAELRAAPFKNLLRQWWRVAAGVNYVNYTDLRVAEGNLFGSVLDDNQAIASKVRFKLTPVKGDFSCSEQEIFFGKTRHPEVKGGFNVSNALYLGFGPITYRKGKTEIRKYIISGSKAKLDLSFPKVHMAEMCEILQYIDAFGTIGSRSRNGWGTISLSGDGFQREDARSLSTVHISHLLDSKQKKQYPSSLGCDDNGLLCWETGPLKEDWKAAMNILAGTYMDLRTSISIKPQGLKERHVLGYPVTNHPVGNWDERPEKRNSGRMPSQLRLMVKRDQKGHLVARILHLPHKLPKKWDNSLGRELDVWKKIHAQLDDNKQFHRCGRAK